jgi:hypothetical protein
MQQIRATGDVHGAVKETALLKAIGRGVDLLGMKDRKF